MKKSVAQLLVNDYRNIRANLELLNDGVIPARLVIASAEPGEGKTTFSINLATSLSRSGKKVLLIDGDFRNMDIARTMNLPPQVKGFCEVMAGGCTFDDAVYTDPRRGLDILAPNAQNGYDPVQILASPKTKEFLDKLSERYDHIIIDTSPVLAAPDSLLWARMADAVVLCSLAGVTNGPALKETMEKFARIKVKILGNVLNNVQSDAGYGYYGYDSDRPSTRKKQSSEAIFLQAQLEDNKPE